MKYAWLTLKHKWYVFLASRRFRWYSSPFWRILVHDLSKFSKAELPHYNRQFCGDKSDPVGFAKAWLHHQNCNPHHWEYWITRSDHSQGKSGAANGCLLMPIDYVKEMIADWMGASMAYTGSWEIREWVGVHLPTMRLHPKTIGRIYLIMGHYRIT